MTAELFLEKLDEFQRLKCGTQTLELKRAGVDCPKCLYDTLSNFSNQDDGGIIVFGIDCTSATCRGGKGRKKFRCCGNFGNWFGGESLLL